MSKVDPITVSVIQHRLVAVVEEMGEAMLRTSYSQILNSSRDFSTAICGDEGRLVAQAEHIPVHVGALPWAVRAVCEFFAGEVRKGDVFLLNDPYFGGSHLPDITAFVPVFAGQRLLFWTVNRAHHSDIGGATHGAYNASATEIWQEGLRLPPLKLYEQGELRRDLAQMLSANVRHERDFQGDLAAQIGSVHLGERRLQHLMEEFGPAVVEAAVEEILDGSERQARAVIATWKDGVFHGEALLDDDGRGNRDIAIRARATVRGSELEIDLRDSAPQVTSFVNSSHANMQSAVAMALAFLYDPETPKNEGSLRPVTVLAKPGTVVWAHPGAPVTLSTSHCSQEIIEAIVRALAPACPDRAMAGWGRRFRIALKGQDPRNGKPFIWHMFHARPGAGASPGGDGWHGAGEWHSTGGLKFGSVEVAEARFPLSFQRHEFRPDSGGDGRYVGGAGVDMELRLETDTPAIANTAGEGTRHGAPGLQGGQDGAPHRYLMHRPGHRRQVLSTKQEGIEVPPGTVFEVHSAGGGGWGAPTDREPNARADDRRNGFVRRRNRMD
ncbi:MAG: hydantoinase B/oxoprolinase family protein [Alphaproteobacteria bacterium]|jgi:N-methylhydantoinase B|nr:5-oxoprolinase [Rhodospirillaceae bacterium]MDP6404492.1 hydantoinase B/oxoprolinase family protein [Alphaproteobacteria bacterium]MDP6624488.1 hydantoinase B/oxoprolinase family protein [Alphaproteobacteria bacterium]